MAINEGHVVELDGLRGFACISVILAHCIVGILRLDAPSPTADFLSFNVLWFLLGGVDLFFVLSGFLIGGILMDSRTASNFFRAFWIRRFARILPALYILLTTYAIALFIRANFDLPWMDIWVLKKPLAPFWTYATFMQSFPIASNGVEQPRWVAITWSLAIEEQFYMLFPFIVYFLTRRALVAVAIAGIVAAPLLRPVFEAFYGNWYAPYILLPCRMDSLLFGVVVALIMRNDQAKTLAIRWRRAIDVTIVIIFYLLAVSHPIIFTWRSIGPFPFIKPSLLALMYALILMRIFLYNGGWINAFLRTKLMVNAGLISYSLYLYHQAVNGVLHGYFFNSEPTISSVQQFLLAVLVIGISVALATVSFVYIERPIRQFGRRTEYHFSNDSNPAQLATEVK